LRALFVLVEGLIKRFRYLDETIAAVLALVAVKILVEPVVKIGPGASLALVFVSALAVIFGGLLSQYIPTEWLQRIVAVASRCSSAHRSGSTGGYRL